MALAPIAKRLAGKKLLQKDSQTRQESFCSLLPHLFMAMESTAKKLPSSSSSNALPIPPPSICGIGSIF
ncbi:hypothetical protein CKAN_00350700 [Cinnamomum micranthum f. kanehirae]|uniref:Uncharacterized protein n=1 Tax=Cinnamomum micranthum f. kanehirae TaxID=337451 RepID=A0A3S3M112_9MAGN|nr:hypothetical protein CKAN_00350700 [Cinnamomum micranthum f. kanehirae]